MSGTEFEKAAGREKAKKWKTSVRVAPVNGKQGEMMGDWLQVCSALMLVFVSLAANIVQVFASLDYLFTSCTGCLSQISYVHACKT